jgi:hypothetical protein
MRGRLKPPCALRTSEANDVFPKESMKQSRRIPWLCGIALWALFGIVGCNLFPTHQNTQTDRLDKEPIAGAPSKHVLRVSQFIFLSDVELRRDHPMFKDLANLREQVNRDLRLPPSNTEVFVYLFEGKDRYEKFMKAKHPELPTRRAYFIAQPRRLGGAEDLMVYTYWGDRLHQDLRHELTHAMLHCVLKTVPIWLDEGLAEYFEIPSGQNGVNPQHLDGLRQASTKFDLDRLETLREVDQMAPAEYRESWAWVHLMMRSTPQAKQALLGYLQELRTNAKPSPIRPRLAPAFFSLDAAVQAHLNEMDRKLPKTSAAKQ